VPIRTPRGRSAAYRSIWQWPLRSPGRLLMTVVVVLAVAFGVTLGLSALRGPQPPGAGPLPTAGPTAGSAARPTGTGASSPTGAPSSEPSPLPLSQAPSEALVAAERWTKAWVRPPDGTSTKQWLDGLRPLTTVQYLGVLSGVDPENIPATKVTGKAKAVRVADRNVQAEVPTDALTLRILLVEDENGWEVAGYDRT
jgi:hypothetical protein